MASPGRSALILVENLSVPFDRRVWQECQSLRHAGYEVAVVCPAGVGRDEQPFEYLDGVAIYRYPLRAADAGVAGYLREYPVAFTHTWRLVRRLARSRQFSVVHACNPPDFLLLAALSVRRRGAALIFDHHDLVPELYLSRFGRGQDLGYSLTRLAERVSFRLADVVISTNGSYRQVALERGRLDPRNVFVVRSAPDLGRFRAVPEVPHLRHGKPHLLVYLGVMGPQDGVDHALRALVELRRHRQDWHATFVGSGDVYDAMLALSKELGLEDMVDFTGRIPNDELLQILSTAHIGLAPDPKNPLNDVSTMNKILEYMAVGLPVVAYDLAEARVSAGDAAAYARPNDPNEFAGKIIELLERPERRSAMSEIGRRRVADDLSWEHSEANLLRAYDRAIEHRAARSPKKSVESRFRGAHSNGDLISHRRLRLLITVTLNRNQLRSHLLPLLALDEIGEIVLVADQPATPPLPGVHTIVPPRLLSRVVGRAAAKLIVCAVVARRTRPDWVIGLNLVPHGVNAYLAGRLAGSHVLYHQIGGPREWLGGGWDSDNKVLGRLRGPSRTVERLLLGVVRRVDIIAAMGERGRETLIEHGVDASRVAVVPAAFDSEQFETLSAAPPEYDLVTVGELLPVKRTQDFLTAVAELNKNGRRVRAAVLGAGPLREQLEAVAGELGIRDAVSFLGFRDDVHAICARSRVFVLSSQYEGLSIALVDAMACGTPPVVTDVGELRSVVEDGVTGFLYCPGDVDALTDTLRRLLGDEALQRRVGDAARQRAHEIASVNVVAATLRAALCSPLVAEASPTEVARQHRPIERTPS